MGDGVVYHNNPKACLDFTVPLQSGSADEVEIRDDALRKVAKAIVAGWSKAEISIEILQGGLTNNLFLLCNQVDYSKVIIRIYGAGK